MSCALVGTPEKMELWEGESQRRGVICTVHDYSLAKIELLLPVGHLLNKLLGSADEKGLTEPSHAECEGSGLRPDVGGDDGCSEKDGNEDGASKLVASLVLGVRARRSEGTIVRGVRSATGGEEQGRASLLGEALQSVRKVSQSILRRLGQVANDSVPLCFGLLGLELALLPRRQLLDLAAFRLHHGALLRQLDFLFGVRVITATLGLFLADGSVAVMSLFVSSNDDANTEALDDVRKLPGLLLDLLGFRAVLDGVTDTGKDRLVTSAVGGVRSGGSLAGRRRDGREEELARRRVDDESDLWWQRLAPDSPRV